MSKYGEVEDIAVSENICDHMIGNVYVKFRNEESSDMALQKLTGRYYNTRLLRVELSPLTDFKEARCRQFEEAQCGRGGYCNFVHWKYVPRRLRRRLKRDALDEHPEWKEMRRSGRGGDRDRGTETKPGHLDFKFKCFIIHKSSKSKILFHDSSKIMKPKST